MLSIRTHIYLALVRPARHDQHIDHRFNIQVNYRVMALSLTESTDCGVSKLNSSLTFGTLSNMSFDAESAEFPWMASLQIRGNHFCGGAIIDQRWVLTAAHCALLMIKFNIYLSDTSLNKYAIIVGVIDRTDRRFKYNVEKVVINDCFNIHGIGFDDIALLKTDRDIDFMTTEDNSYLINSICLPKGDPIDYKVFFSGWGQYSEYDGPVIDQPKFLKKTVQRLSDMEVCRVAMLVISGGLSFASIDNLCVGNSDSSACYGDSGGPLIQMVNKRWHVLGVASFTINSCNFEDPVIYTKVSHYREWIGLAINYSNTNDQNFIYFGCNRFVIFHELKPLVHYFRSFVTRLSLAKDYFHNLA